MPALPRNCYKTPHGFIFRIVVPKAFRLAIGKCEIKKALGKDYREAVSQTRILSVQVDRQFSELYQKADRQESQQQALDAYLAKPPDKRLIPLTEITPDLVSGLRHLWLATLEADLSWRREGLDDDEYDELDQSIGQMKGLIAKAIARGQPEAFVPAIRNLLFGRGYQLAVSSEDELKLALDVLPAIQEGYDILEQRQAGRMVGPLKLEGTPLRAAWESGNPSISTKGISWQQLREHWQNDRTRPAKTNKEVETYINAISILFPKMSARGKGISWAVAKLK